MACKGEMMGSQLELGQLLATNKSLAQEKREIHRQKLRVYSQKTVKLKEMMRQAEDQQQRKCIENKLRHLQQKQDAQISKLSKIEQIERQIDEFITEESEQSGAQKIANSGVKKQNKGKCLEQKLSKIQNTPAQRLRTKSSALQRTFFETHQGRQNVHEKMHKHGSFAKKESNFEQPDQWLLSSSKEALSQISIDNNQGKRRRFSNGSSKKIVQFEKKQNQKDRINQFRKSNEFISICDPSNQISHEQMFPDYLKELIDKVSKYFPKQLSNLITFITEAQSVKREWITKDSMQQTLIKERSNLKQVEIDRQFQQKRIKDIQKRIQVLIQKQRSFMQKIDNLQSEQTLIVKKVYSALNMIKKSKDIIIQSSFSAFQEVHFNYNPSMNNPAEKRINTGKLSVDLNESMSSESLGPLSHELDTFEHSLQQFLLTAERQSMMMAGELQQINLKMGRAKQQSSNLDSKKKYLQSQIVRLDKNISNKTSALSELKQSYERVESELKDFQVVHGLKRNLIGELEDKCDKLKSRKKGLAEKVKRAEEDLEAVTLKIHQKQQSFANLEQQFDKLQERKEELENAFIFKQRQIEKKEKENSELDKIKSGLQAKNRQMYKLNAQAKEDINKNQAHLAQLCLQISARMLQQKSLDERINKMQQQLAESVSLLDQQNSVIAKQKQQVSLRSSEYLQLQKKIALTSTNILGLQTEQSRIEQRIEALKVQSQQQQAQLQQIGKARHDLELILRDVLSKKQTLFSEVEQKTSELDALIQDLERGQSDLGQLQTCLSNIEEAMCQKQEQQSKMQQKISLLRMELDEQIEEEGNLLSRIGRLRQTEKHILIECGIKGLSNYMQGDLKARVGEAVAELSCLQELKAQMKECKYQNRKLRLDNKRLAKLVEEEEGQHSQ